MTRLLCWLGFHARAADAAHDGDGEPYPVTMSDVGVRP